MAAPALELRRIGKSYGATQALADVSLCFEPGRVHALVGRNGAGKSTLVKILAGAVTPDSGECLVDGQVVRFRTPVQALARGIATVHQELSLIGELSVAENLLLGHLPRRRHLPFLIDHRAMERRAASLLESMGLDIDPRARVASLSFAEAQVVEIARAASFAPRALLLDEPTSALSPAEVEALFRVVRELAARGVGVVYVTHRLDEIARIADTVSALRDGRHVGTITAGEATPSRLVELMFGTTAIRREVRAARSGGTALPVLEARDLVVGHRLSGVDLKLHQGEILGIAGLLGSGRTELLEALFGARRIDGGEVVIAGERIADPTPRRMTERGVALVPEDRKRQGLALALSVLDNASLASLKRLSRRGFMWRALQRLKLAPVLDSLHVSSPSLDHEVATLSGGNQQKVVVAKWLLEPRRALLLDEPTKGVDLEARRELFEAVRKLASEGVAIVMVSSELEELLETCDRILVLREGRVVAELDPAATSLHELLALAMGAAA